MLPYCKIARLKLLGNGDIQMELATCLQTAVSE